MNLRIEVDEMGRHVLILPEDLIEEYQLDDGDSVQAEFIEDGILEVNFQY